MVEFSFEQLEGRNMRKKGRKGGRKSQLSAQSANTENDKTAYKARSHEKYALSK